MKNPYGHIVALLLFVMVGSALTAQQRLLPFRVFFSMSPTLSTGTRFENGSTIAATPNITGTHYLHPLFSFLWGRPNPQYTPLQNFARKFNYSLFFEVAVTRRKSITTGFEIGARGYSIQSDQSDDFIIMYRNINIPVFYTYTVLPGTYWKWNLISGAAINRASSVPKLTYEVFDIKHTPKIYPTVFVGTELSYLQTKGPFTYGLEYHHGFKNVIDHRYYALDYVKGMKVLSNGSHFRLNIKWYFTSGFFKLKQKKAKETPDVLKPELDPYGSIIYRTRKKPVLVRVKNPQISICLRDDQTIDGDSITVEFNGLIIARTVALNRTEQCYTIDLSPTGENQLAVHALNLGRIPPNTYEVIYYDGDYREVLNLKSDMEYSSTINFIVDPNMEHK